MKTAWGLFFLVAGYLHATLAVIHDIKTMTRKSAVIVDADVVKQQVYEDSKGRIITLTTLKVKDGLKGAEEGQELTVYQVGGELRGLLRRSILCPTPHFPGRACRPCRLGPGRTSSPSRPDRDRHPSSPSYSGGVEGAAGESGAWVHGASVRRDRPDGGYQVESSGAIRPPTIEKRKHA